MSAETEPLPRGVSLLLSIIAVAISYFILGKASLLLASQPGYASPLWPPSGVAFVALLVYGYRLWPGVLLGSFLVNAGIAYDGSSTIGVALLSVAPTAGIGLAAALQAVVGVALVRRFVGCSVALVSPRDILRFLILGGPISCFVSCSLSITILVASGAILPGEALISWSAWWVGDSLGVLIVAPLLLIVFGKPRVIWWRRKFSLGLPLVLTLAFSLVLALFANVLEERRIKLTFDSQSLEMMNSIERKVSGVLEILYSIRGLFESSVEVDRDEFRNFVTRSFDRHPGIQAVTWVPKTYAAGRSPLEGRAQADGLEGYQIWEESPGEERVPVGNRPEYFPVFFLEPLEGNEDALGFDLGSEENRRRAMTEAEETGDPAATAPLRLVQDTEHHMAALIFLAIYDEIGREGAAKERHDHLRGFVNVVLRIGDVVDDALKDFDDVHIHVEIEDVTNPMERDFLYRYAPPGATEDFSEAASAGDGDAASVETGGALPPVLAEGVEWDVINGFGARSWELRFRPDRRFIYGNRSWGQWAILAGGLLFTGLLGAMLLIVTGNTVRVEAIVAERTRELDDQTKLAVLEASEARVARDQAERAESALLEKAGELERSNKELEQFAYVASHDLQEPLRMVTSYMQLLEKRYEDQLDSDGKEFIGFAAEGAGRMHQMIRDLLDYSRITARSRDFAEIDCERILSEARNQLTVSIRESSAIITSDPLPKVRGDESQLLSLFQNLLANAVKYRDETSPKIHVSAEKSKEGEEWIFSICDNGIGIKPEHAERIFAIFQRLHRKGDYSGTGIGLAICRKIVERHDGRIWMEAAPEMGSVFKFTLPVS